MQFRERPSVIPKLCIGCTGGRMDRAVIEPKGRKQPLTPGNPLKYNDSTSLLFGLICSCLVSLALVWACLLLFCLAWRYLGLCLLVQPCQALEFLAFRMTVRSEVTLGARSSAAIGQPLPVSSILRRSPLGRLRTINPPINPQTFAAPPQLEILSNATLLVRGPNTPIVAITTTIAPAMKTNTPLAPKFRSNHAMRNDEKITDSRLQE